MRKVVGNAEGKVPRKCRFAKWVLSGNIVEGGV
jgi:hypothetical protein